MSFVLRCLNKGYINIGFRVQGLGSKLKGFYRGLDRGALWGLLMGILGV